MKNQVRTQLVRWVSPAWLSVLTALAILWSGETAQANVRLETTGGPFYARIAGNLNALEVYHDGVWAAIAFYRDPGCVQDDFNLLDFFNPAALDCESYVAGFEIWKHGPGTVDIAPIQGRLQNTADMPIWFVSWTELQAVIADNVLTISELAALPSLVVGYATFYTETVHPLGGGPQTMVSIVASGYFFREDKSTGKFSYQATGTKEENRLNHVKIQFK